MLVRFYCDLRPEQQQEKAKAYLMRLANLFSEYGCTSEGVARVVRRCRETEFRGTSYSPLPDEGAIIRIIHEVNQQMVAESRQDPSAGGERWMNQAEVRAGFARFWAKHDEATSVGAA